MKASRVRTTVVGLALTVALVESDRAAAQIGSCTTPTVDAYLDVGNVRARILANGNLFWRGDPYVYEVPKGGGVNALFAAGFWIGGMVDGELRVAAAQYGNFNFWTGPIDENGNPPADCADYERIWSVYRADVRAFEEGAEPSDDLASWPTGLGAPTLAPADGDGVDNDEDGRVDEAGEMKRIHDEILELPLPERGGRGIDLEAGERPDVLGDQMLWWIMNDNGNEHPRTETPPLGIEVHASAFAFDVPGDLGNSTFYRLRVFQKADHAVDSTYIALFADPDLGFFGDDYVGTDTTLSLAFAYNADNEDEGGYGFAPPAVGHDLFQGAIVPSPGDTAIVSGRRVPGHRNLSMTSALHYEKSGGPSGEPVVATEYYNYFRGLWKDGRPLREYGDGFDESSQYPITRYKYSGDPVRQRFWSELNINDSFPRTENPPADRRYMMASGPFRLEPGDVQEIAYGIVWARGSGNLDSVTELRDASRAAQVLYEANFAEPERPDPPTITLTPLDRAVSIEWGNAPGSNNYLDSYRELNPFADPDGPWATFEGYEVWRFATAEDETGQLVAVYDRVNEITEIVQDLDGDGYADRTTYGRDSGVKHAHLERGLTNYRTYHYGVRAYTYSKDAPREVEYSEMARGSVVPTPTAAVLSESALEAAMNRDGFDFTAERIAGVGDGTIGVDVVNPAAVVDAEYRVEFYTMTSKSTSLRTPIGNADSAAPDAVPPKWRTTSKLPEGAVTYDVYRGETKVFDGSAGVAPAPKDTNVFVADGLEFTVLGPVNGIQNFLTTANASGELDPPDIGAFAFNDNGFPFWEQAPDSLHDRPTPGYQQSTNESTWGMNVGGGTGSFASFLSRSLRNDNVTRLGPYDYEMRFDGGAHESFRGFEDGELVDVPFTLWRTGAGTPNDPSDDVQMVAVICESGCGHAGEDLTYDIAGDHPVSGGADDPLTDWVYWYLPSDETPGSVGHDAYYAGNQGVQISEVLARTVLVNWNGGSSPPYNADLPEDGTVFRMVTSKPLQAGDVFAFSTAGYGATEPDLETRRARLAEIGIVPNPYKAFSDYEVDLANDEVRLTGLPDVATIRVFTLHGTLVRTLEKDSPGLRSLSWDVRNEDGRKLASGMYLIHVEVPGVGERVIKFGMVKDGVVE